MRKILIVFILSILGIHQAFAQRDTEHWIAPFYDSEQGYSFAFYLSTDSTVPIDVDVFSGNTLVTTVQGVAKGNPKIWNLTTQEAQQYLTATSPADALVPRNKGLQLVGGRPFMVSLRIAKVTHGETLTLKGKSALGKEFRIAATPFGGNNPSDWINATAGILATEDNTTVTVSEYGNNVVFLNGSNNTPPSYTFTLNKGQSVIFACKTVTSMNNFIGTKVVANKPVTLTNGNANGNFGSTTTAGSDLIMDQSVPVERLGNTFAMVRSLSPLTPDRNMEGGVVIATEDNTEVYINGLTTPVATLNAGQYHRIPSTSYIDQGNGHYNMYVSTTKNVYLYQLVGMEDTYSGGYNYIPPLGCYLPRVIDEIGNINVMPTINSQINLKLNIITQPGANVEVFSNNNLVTNVEGPFNVNGTSDWVTYVAPNITGNVMVRSSRAVTAGINGGYSTAGYGGYFAGFSLAPTIELISGECVPGIVIGVDPIFETYQWYLDGNPIAGATSNTITPTQPGSYTLRVLLTGCDYVTTDPYKVYPCTYEKTIEEVACGVKVIPVSFTNSNQPVDSNSITIVTQPANGTLNVNPFMNTITYTPNPGYAGPDTFVYEFKSTVAEFGDKEKVTVKLNVVDFITNDGNLAGCPYGGTANYDLTVVAVTNYPNATMKYYRTLADAQNDINPIAIPAAYDSAAGDVYVRVTTPEGCVKFAKITLTHNNQPVVKNARLSSCFIEGNPTAALFDLTTADVGAGANFVKKFYASLADAEHDRNEIPNPDAYTSPTTTVYVRVYNAGGCYSIAEISLAVIEPRYSDELKDVVICLEGRATLDAGTGFDGYLWSTGATTSSISDVPVGEYWVDLLSNGCKTRQIVRVIKSPEPIITNVEIKNKEAIVSVIGGTPPYQYSLDKVVWQTSNVLPNLNRGLNSIFVKDAFNCSPVVIEALVPNLINAITPDGDGVNDVLDYSELSFDNTLSVVIYDRYGAKIFEGNKKNGYKWDGTIAGKRVPTDTYWYTLTWVEPITKQTTVKYSGWIMVRNIE